MMMTFSLLTRKKWYVEVRIKTLCCIFPKTTRNANAQDVLTANAVEEFLHRKQINVLIENGGICPASLPGAREELNVCSIGAILQEEEAVIPDESKAIFYAVAELVVKYLSFKSELIRINS